MNRTIQLSALLVLLVALGGCRVFRASCEAPPSGKEVATIPTLRVPEGVPPADTASALKIPDLTEPERMRTSGEPCLEDPPMYTAGWQPEEKRQEEAVPGTPEEPKKKRRWWWPWG